MTKEQFLENAFKSLNEGKITEQGYDYLVSNINDYVNKEEEQEDVRKKNL